MQTECHFERSITEQNCADRVSFRAKYQGARLCRQSVILSEAKNLILLSLKIISGEIHYVI